MRIAFMGTPEFAARSLEKLSDSGHDICCCFTQPDKPKGRGMKMIPTPVKTTAVRLAIPVFQPRSLRDGTAMNVLNEYKPELIAVVAYGKLLPPDMLSFPKYGCVNIHASLLPKYRGAAPVQWSILNGDTETGVCSMYMAEEMDAGDVISVKKAAIGAMESFGELYDRLAIIGAELLCETVDSIEHGTADRTRQEHANATFAPVITKSMSAVDWTMPADKIKNLILGLDPQPAAASILQGQVYKLFKGIVSDIRTDKAPGSIIGADKTGLYIACGDGREIVISEIQAPGGKRMKAADYLRGHELSGRFEMADDKR